jgi:citrate lyase subunit beta / citryl-CoA lyase
MQKPLRSTLYLPASNARALEKAKTLDADALILDLEDAVLPEMKAQARHQAIEAANQGSFGFRQIIIRVNGLETPWGKDDLNALEGVKCDGVLIPKVNNAADLNAYQTLNKPLWAMMETSKAMLNAQEIVSAKGLTTLVMGTNDLAKETRTRSRAAMMPWLMTCLAAARMANLTILDGVYNDIANSEGFKKECDEGRDYGFEGKTLIHPSQIESCNAAFSPTQEELFQAQAIIEAFALPENKGKGALNVKGKMVEILHCDMAKALLALDKALKAR